MPFNFSSITKSYSYTPKNNAKDLVEVEIGDSQDATAFFPQVKIKRWDNEINASLRLKHDFITGTISYSDDGTKITWQKKVGKNIWKAVFYDKPGASSEGGFEFEIHLPVKPPVNYLDFSVNTKELDWYYQPELTAEEIAQGAERPNNVVGSYAVYYKNCPANFIGGKEYKCGKAFHLYRPHAVDANGKETWGDWILDEVSENLRLTLPQAFLNTAVYPVIVDPTFGYETMGTTGNNSVAENSYWGSTFSAPTSGSISQLTILGYGFGFDDSYKGIVALNSDRSIVTNGIGSAVSLTSEETKEWVVSTYSSQPSIVSGTSYLLIGITNQFLGRAYYDNGDTNQGIAWGNNYTSPSSPLYNNRNNYKYSIYATYTASETGYIPQCIIS